MEQKCQQDKKSNSKVKVYMGIPSMGDRCDAQCYMMRRWEKKYAEQIEFVYPDVLCQRMFHDFARNAIVEDFLKTDCDVLFFLDSDVCPTDHLFDLVTEHWDKWMVSGAAYPTWMNASGRQQVYWSTYKKAEGKAGFLPNRVLGHGIDYTDALATGCMLIKRAVLEMMEPPYFEFKFDEKTRALQEGEDLGFCLKTYEMGYRFFTDHSMVCRHYKKVDLLDVNNFASDVANASVERYDKAIRGKVQRVEAALREKITPKKEKPSSKLILPDHLNE